MTCPPELIRPLSEIIRNGTLRARAAAWSGDCQRAAIESDHIHNLPGLIADFSEDRLRYYWEAERQDYLDKSKSLSVGEFERAWADVQQFVESHSGMVA
jgi:hypothetical protein